MLATNPIVLLYLKTPELVGEAASLDFAQGLKLATVT